VASGWNTKPGGKGKEEEKEELGNILNA